MIVKTIIPFENYSEDALNVVINKSIGKPIRIGGPFDIDAKIGTIVGAKRVGDTKYVEFECEITRMGGGDATC